MTIKISNRFSGHNKKNRVPNLLCQQDQKRQGRQTADSKVLSYVTGQGKGCSPLWLLCDAWRLHTTTGNWFVLLNLSESDKEGKVEGLPRYRRTGIKAVRYTEENGILRMVRESLWRRRRTAGHNMVLDEAWFHLSGYVNSQNTCTWATEHPHEIHEVPLHSEKTGVVCNLQASHNRSNFLPRDFEYYSLSANLQRICGST